MSREFDRAIANRCGAIFWGTGFTKAGGRHRGRTMRRRTRSCSMGWGVAADAKFEREGADAVDVLSEP